MKRRRLILVMICILALMLALFSGCKKKEESEEDLTPPIKPVVNVPENETETEPEVAPETTPEPEPEPEPITYTGKVYNTDNGVNIRKGPSTDDEILMAADVGEIFTVLEAGEWCKIQLEDGTIGYIKGEFLELTPNT